MNTKMKSIAALLVGSCLAGAASLASATTTVTFWMHDHPPRVTVDKQIIASFEAANPNIKIDYEVIPYADFAPRLLSGFAAGAGPVLFNMENTDMGQYLSSGFLDPVDLKATGLGSTKSAQKAYGIGLEGSIYNGKAYGLPTEVSNWVCVANNGLWQSAGLDPKKDIPRTWEELVSVSKKLTVTNDAGVATQRGFDFNWQVPLFFWLTFEPMVRQLGVELIDEKTLTANFNNPQVARVMEYWADWVNKHSLGGPQYTASRDAFLAGELAIDCSFGIWGKPQFTNANIDFTYFPAPRWKDAVTHNGLQPYAFYLHVNASAPEVERQAAWQFSRFYTQHGEELFNKAGLLTTQPVVLSSNSVVNDEWIPVFLEELNKSKFSPRFPGFKEITDQLVSARDRILAGEDTSEVLSDLQKDATRVLKRAKR